MMRVALRAAGAVVFAVAAACAAPLRAQQVDARLDARVDAHTRVALAALLDSARAEGLPTEPLVSKALEGASIGADGTRIMTAVRGLRQRLGAARAVLGSASASDLVAGAAALKAGIEPATLTRLRAARPKDPLAVALVVLADLVSRGVPADTAGKLILAVATKGAGDEAFDALRRDVARDIVAGAPPLVAAAVRTQGVLGTTADATGTGLTNTPRKKP